MPYSPSDSNILGTDDMSRTIFLRDFKACRNLPAQLKLLASLQTPLQEPLYLVIKECNQLSADLTDRNNLVAEQSLLPDALCDFLCRAISTRTSVRDSLRTLIKDCARSESNIQAGIDIYLATQLPDLIQAHFKNCPPPAAPIEAAIEDAVDDYLNAKISTLPDKVLREAISTQLDSAIKPAVDDYLDQILNAKMRQWLSTFPLA